MTAVEPPKPDSDSSPGYVTGIADGNLATPVKLRDYLVGVGTVFRLPKRDRKKEKAEAREEEAKKARFRIPVRQIIMALAPVAIAGVGYVVWDSWLSSVPIPSNIVGTWSTNDGKYAGRNFWLNQKAVAFQNGTKTDQFSIHEVKRVKATQVADTLFLNVDYEQDGGAITLSLAYLDTPRPEIKFVNQPDVRWWRTGNAPVISK
jgi:hypothetical protein